MIYIYEFDNAIEFKHQGILLFWYLGNFLEKRLYRGDQLRRFVPFSYLNNSVIESKY